MVDLLWLVIFGKGDGFPVLIADYATRVSHVGYEQTTVVNETYEASGATWVGKDGRSHGYNRCASAPSLTNHLGSDISFIHTRWSGHCAGDGEKLLVQI